LDGEEEKERLELEKRMQSDCAEPSGEKSDSPDSDWPTDEGRQVDDFEENSPNRTCDPFNLFQNKLPRYRATVCYQTIYRAFEGSADRIMKMETVIGPL
jgi:hypothetical protein